MNITTIVGLQSGDEAKGKLTDYLASRSPHTIARFNGGPNAGHTIYVNGEKTVLHVIPSGILNPDNTNIIGSGCIIDLNKLYKEIKDLQNRDVKISPNNLKISGKVHIILPIHIALDKAREVSRGKDKIGTTACGIGPCYEDKANRNGIRLIDLLNYDVYCKKIRTILVEKNAIIANYDKSLCQSVPDQLEYIEKNKEFILSFMDLNINLNVTGNMIVEGAQGTMLDIDHGIYPYVSSSSIVSGGMFSSLNIDPHINNINYIGIIKPYLTSVSGAPMPTEELGEIGNQICKVGKEFGSTTGRRRRIGWLDSVQLNYAMSLSTVHELAVMKLDVLTGIPELKICNSYNYKSKIIRNFPIDPTVLKECTPNYTVFEGWDKDITGIREFEKLPENAKKFLNYISLLRPIKYIGTGPNRDDLITLIRA